MENSTREAFFFVVELHAPIDIWEKNVANREGEF
jgi:hypothetical protein